MGDAGAMSGGTTDTVSAKGDDVSCERASGVQDLSSEMSRQIASTSGAAHAAASGDGGRKSHSSVCRWTLPDFTKTRARQVWSDFQTVAGRECRLLVYPKGDSMALPGYISAYLQVDASKESATSARNGTSPTTGADADWECFVSYELAVVRPTGASSPHAGSASTGAAAEAGARRDSWHRFSSRKKSHGWCDFARSAVVLDSKNGYLVDDTLTVEARIIFLNESSELVAEPASSGKDEPPLTGKFTWTVENLRHFAVMLKTQKVMSPSFVVGDCAFRLSAYQSAVKRSARGGKNAEDGSTEDGATEDGSTECLSLCLESKEIDTISGDKVGALSARTAALGAGAGGAGQARVSKVAGDAALGAASGVAASRSCWLVFRVTAAHQADGKKSVHRDSYGRFAGDALGGDTTSLGWNDFMPMATFAGGDDLTASVDAEIVEGGGTGFLEGPDGRAVFSVSFHAAREACEARTHHRRADACVGPVTAILAPDGAVRATGGGVPDGKLGSAASLRIPDTAGRRLRSGKRGERLLKDGAADAARSGGVSGGVSGKGHPFAGDAHDVVGRFVWRLDNFTKLKDILKKRKMSGLSVKSRRFSVGGFSCRLIAYPRGQSHPPNHLSMFLEVADPESSDRKTNSDGDVFVSHRLSVCNQLDRAKSVSRESQNRYGRGAKDWGWREFLTLTTLFDEDAGFLVNDTVVFTAEVRVLREKNELGPIPKERTPPPTNQMRFNPRRLARFIARYGLEEKEAEAARFLFGDRFEEVKAAALARAERAAARAPGGERDGAPKLELGALLATDIRDARTQEAKRRALREALGGPEEQRARVAENASKRDDGSGDDGSRDSDASSDSDSDADADLKDVHIQTPSLAQMAYVKAATDAKLPIASRLVTERGMAPLEGEGVNVAFNWRVELFAAFKDVLETKKIYSRFFRAAPGVELRLGVYESWETLCVYLEPEACVAGGRGGGRSGSASEPALQNHWVRYRLGLVHQRDARKTVWKENSVCTRTKWTSQVSQFVKMDELLDPENGFVVKDTVVVACEVLDCCPWFDENKLTYPDAEGPDAGQRAEGHADGARDDRAAAAAVEALTQTLSSAGLGDAGVAREFGRILAGAENFGAENLGARASEEEEEESASSKKKNPKPGGGGALADVLGLGGLGLDAFQSELLDKDPALLGAGANGANTKPEGLRPPLSESLRQNDLLRAALKSSGFETSETGEEAPEAPGAFPAERDDATKRGVAFDQLLRAVGIDPASLARATEDETEAALLDARRTLREALEANPSARDAFPAAMRVFLSPRGAAEAAARECVSGIPHDGTIRYVALEPWMAPPFVPIDPTRPSTRHHLAVLCGCDVLRGVAYERLLAAVLEACGALNEAIKTRGASSSDEAFAKALFETRVAIGALTRLCDLAEHEVDPEALQRGVEPAPAFGAEATRARLAQALNAPWPPVLPIEHGQVFYPRIALAARVAALVPRSAQASAAGRSLVAPLLQGALGAYADGGVSTYFAALRFLDARESDESVAFAECVAAIKRGGARREIRAESDATNRETNREFDDQLVAEALDYAFFVASARATRAKNAAASEKNAAALSQAPGASSFAEAARAALDSLELRADITETSGLKDAFVGDHPVLESLRAWMLERSAVADAVADRLKETFLVGDAETERVSSAPAAPATAAAHFDAEKPKKEKTKAERRAAVREAAEREADARELAAINAVVGKASFGKRRETHLRNAAGKHAPTSGTSGDAYPDPDPDAKTQKEDAKTRQARRGEALAPLAVVSLAQWAFHFANTPGAAIGAAASSPPAKTLRAALAAHPAAAMAARRWIRNVSLDLDEGNFFDDDDIGEARVFGVAAVASVLATPDVVGLGSRKDGDARNRRAPATDGALAFVDALGAFAERHSRGDDDDDDDDGEYGYRAKRRHRASQDYATLCDALAELLASSQFDDDDARIDGSCDGDGREPDTRKAPSDARKAPSTHEMLTRVLASALAEGGASSFARASDRAGADAVDDDAALEALGARDARDDAAWAAVRAKARKRESDAASGSARGLDAAPAAARVLRSGAARLRAAREEAARARASAETAAARAEETARKLESDAAKLSRDRKTVASARAETELKARRVADEARLHVSKIERERDAMRDKARDAERAGDWARDEANELRRAASLAASKQSDAEARARDAEERLRRREEETRKERLGAEQTKRRGDELAAKLRDAETRARDAERRLAEMERLEAERRKRSDQLGGEVTRDELLNRRGLRLPTQRDAGVIGGDANPPRFANPPPGYAAFERPKPFADGEKRAAPIGPVVGGGDSYVAQSSAVAKTLAREGAPGPGAPSSAGAPFGGGALFGLGGGLLGGLGNGTWSGDGDTWR